MIEFKIKKPMAIPKNYLQKLRGLTKECCNFSSGYCDALDCRCLVCNDEEHINCMWYVNCVLPLNRELEEVVMKENELGKTVKRYNKTCTTCGKKFETVAKTTRMCLKCSKKAERDRKKAYKIRQGIK